MTPTSAKSSRPQSVAKPTSATSPAAAVTPVVTPGPVDDIVTAWPGIVRTLKATVRALYSAVEVVGLEGDTLVVAAPSDMHKKKCTELQEPVRAALATAAGRPIAVEIRVQPSRSSATVSAARPAGSKPKMASTITSDDSHESDTAHEIDTVPDIEIDDGAVPADSVVDHIAKSFPGSRIVDSSKK